VKEDGCVSGEQESVTPSPPLERVSEWTIRGLQLRDPGSDPLLVGFAGCPLESRAEPALTAVDGCCFPCCSSLAVSFLLAVVSSALSVLRSSTLRHSFLPRFRGRRPRELVSALQLLISMATFLLGVK
jgi:hypothetical protein